MLKKQKGNMYEFVSHMWSPIKGKCSHSCEYCYMMRWGKQRPIHLDAVDLRTQLGNGRYIFVCHTSDMFAADIPDEWIRKVLARCCDFNNKYLFQSKNPSRIYDFLPLLPRDCVIGTTIETNRDTVVSNAPPVLERAVALHCFLDTESGKRYETMVTIEPIYDFDLREMVEIIMSANPTWVNIGADSKGHGLPEPDPEKVRQLIAELEEYTDIKIKGNLGRIMG